MPIATSKERGSSRIKNSAEGGDKSVPVAAELAKFRQYLTRNGCIKSLNDAVWFSSLMKSASSLSERLVFVYIISSTCDMIVGDTSVSPTKENAESNAKTTFIGSVVEHSKKGGSKKSEQEMYKNIIEQLLDSGGWLVLNNWFVQYIEQGRIEIVDEILSLFEKLPISMPLLKKGTIPKRLRVFAKELKDGHYVKSKAMNIMTKWKSFIVANKDVKKANNNNNNNNNSSSSSFLDNLTSAQTNSSRVVKPGRDTKEPLNQSSESADEKANALNNVSNVSNVSVGETGESPEGLNLNLNLNMNLNSNKKSKKRVSWKPDDKLVEVKLFLKDTEYDDAESESEKKIQLDFKDAVKSEILSERDGATKMIYGYFSYNNDELIEDNEEKIKTWQKIEEVELDYEPPHYTSESNEIFNNGPPLTFQECLECHGPNYKYVPGNETIREGKNVDCRADLVRPIVSNNSRKRVKKEEASSSFEGGANQQMPQNMMMGQPVMMMMPGQFIPVAYNNMVYMSNVSQEPLQSSQPSQPQTQTQKKKVVCRDFSQGRECKFGSKCRFLHE